MSVKKNDGTISMSAVAIRVVGALLVMAGGVLAKNVVDVAVMKSTYWTNKEQMDHIEKLSEKYNIMQMEQRQELIDHTRYFEKEQEERLAGLLRVSVSDLRDEIQEVKREVKAKHARGEGE